VEGIAPGDGVEDIQDGWQVSFAKYIISVGQIELHRASHDPVANDEIYAVDLKKIPENGLPLWSFTNLKADTWTFNYGLVNDTTVVPHASVKDNSQAADGNADFAALKQNDWTYLIEGTLTQTNGRSCPPPSLANIPAGKAPVGLHRGVSCYANSTVAFRLAIQAETHYTNCEVNGMPGVSISADGTQSVAITIHGDHIFFNGFPSGSEGGVMRLAQWLADSDLNLDGSVTQDELERIKPADLVEIDSRYQLSAAQLNDMWDYIAAQLRTQGHFQGEGECTAEGEAHEHF